MRKLFLTLLGLGAAFFVYGDDGSEAVLRRVAERVAAMGDYHAIFEVRAEGGVIAGSYAVSGARWWMKTPQMEIICDGRTRWEVNVIDREVLVDRVQARAGDILSDPTQAFKFAPAAFSSVMNAGGEVVLTPLSGGSLRGVVMRVSPQTGLPVELRYRQEGFQGEVVVRIASIVRGLPEGVRFVFDRSKFPGYEVVDFR